MGNWETAGRNEDRSAAQDTSGEEGKVNPSHLQISVVYEFYYSLLMSLECQESRLISFFSVTITFPKHTH